MSLCRRGKHDRPTFSLSSLGNPVRPHDRGDRRCAPAGWFTSHTSRPPAGQLDYLQYLYYYTACYEAQGIQPNRSTPLRVCGIETSRGKTAVDAVRQSVVAEHQEADVNKTSLRMRQTDRAAPVVPAVTKVSREHQAAVQYDTMLPPS